MDFSILETEMVVFSRQSCHSTEKLVCCILGVGTNYDPLVRTLLFYVKTACGAKL